MLIDVVALELSPTLWGWPGDHAFRNGVRSIVLLALLVVLLATGCGGASGDGAADGLRITLDTHCGVLSATVDRLKWNSKFGSYSVERSTVDGQFCRRTESPDKPAVPRPASLTFT